MAQRSSPTAWRRVVPSILIGLGLVAFLWALLGLYREGLSPALPPTSTASPLPPTVISSPTGQPSVTPSPTASPTRQAIPTSLPTISPSKQPTPTPLPTPSPSKQSTPTPLPSATPTPTTAESSPQRIAPEKGALAPDFSLRQVGGGSVQLSALRGQPVLLNFWATWCHYCRQQIPVLNEAYDRHEAQGFVVLGVDLVEEEEQVAAAMTEEGISYPVLLDATGQVGQLYRVLGIPLNLFIDSQGIISAVHIGPLDGKAIHEYLAPLLPPEEEEPGPNVGQKAPDFSLPNAQGGTFTLSDLRGDRKVVLVFYHSVC